MQWNDRSERILTCGELAVGTGKGDRAEFIFSLLEDETAELVGTEDRGASLTDLE